MMHVREDSCAGHHINECNHWSSSTPSKCNCPFDVVLFRAVRIIEQHMGRVTFPFICISTSKVGRPMIGYSIRSSCVQVISIERLLIHEEVQDFWTWQIRLFSQFHQVHRHSEVDRRIVKRYNKHETWNAVIMDDAEGGIRAPFQRDVEFEFLWKTTMVPPQFQCPLLLAEWFVIRLLSWSK